ncbi:hypothetical protein CJI97_000423 [Candidozyma auris]|nr:hypothetical protein CJI97_000423 [[Candida] auris]
MEEILARHKKEQRDLVSRITGLKKQATKKTRKHVLAQCEELQRELDLKHKKELNEANGVNHEEAESAENGEEVSPEALLKAMNLDEGGDEKKNESGEPRDIKASEESSSPAPRKRNRAKERLQRRQAQLDKIRDSALEEAAGETDYRAMEHEVMSKVLAANGLKIEEIKPDGHCLFASIQDQLKERGGVSVTVETLRREAAEYIRQHRDEFLPFLFDEETMQLRDVDEYTNEIETTAMWGSDMEILALAKRYMVTVKVFSAGSAPITFNEEVQVGRSEQDGENEVSKVAGKTLNLAFYKHNYGLGEHYDSCRDEQNPTDSS